MTILADALGLMEANRRVHPNGALQRAFGRDDWAEQPVIRNTRNMSTPENVQQMQQAVKAVYQHQNTSYGSASLQALQLVDIDMTVIDPHNWTPCERSVGLPEGSSQ